MKLVKKSFNYAVKKTRNYQSVSVGEGIEFEMEEYSQEDSANLEIMKQEMMDRINKEAEKQLSKCNQPEQVQEKPKEDNRTFEEVKGKKGVYNVVDKPPTQPLPVDMTEKEGREMDKDVKTEEWVL